LNFFDDLDGDFGKARAHGRREIIHLYALAIKPDLVQQTGNILDAALGDDITFQVMAVSFQSTGYQHAVGPPLKSAQGLPYVQLARAGYLDHAHVGGILQAHSPGQVGGGVGAVLAGKGHDFRLKVVVFAHAPLTY
jgi:hypothetical protein